MRIQLPFFVGAVYQTQQNSTYFLRIPSPILIYIRLHVTNISRRPQQFKNLPYRIRRRKGKKKKEKKLGFPSRLLHVIEFVLFQMRGKLHRPASLDLDDKLDLEGEIGGDPLTLPQPDVLLHDPFLVE